MRFPGPLVVAIAEVVAELRRGDARSQEVCNRFLIALGTVDGEQDAGPNEPTKRTRVRDENVRERERIAAEKRRRENGVLPKSDRQDSGRILAGLSTDATKGSQTLQKAEENRNLCLSGQSSAEIETSEKCASSHSRARPSESDRQDSGRTRTDVGRTLRRLQDALGGQWDMHSWRSELERIALKPEAEFAVVLEHMKADTYVRDNLGICHPGHIIKHWGKYLQPPKGKRPVDEQPTTKRYVDRGMDAEMHRQLAADQAGLYGITGGKRG